jgi:hypothetical protein
MWLQLHSPSGKQTAFASKARNKHLARRDAMPAPHHNPHDQQKAPAPQKKEQGLFHTAIQITASQPPTPTRTHSTTAASHPTRNHPPSAHNNPNTATPLVAPTYTLPRAIIGVMNLLPAPH